MSEHGLRLGLIGATGVVGATTLRVLEERRVPVDELRAYASRDRDFTVRFKDRDVPVFGASTDRLLADANDVVVFCSSDDASAEMARALAAAGQFIVDNSATFRMDPDCPLVIPEINPDAVLPHHRIFPVGNCTAIILLMALAPIARTAGLRAVRVASYQAVSGAGRAGLEALAREEEGAEPDGTFAAPIFRNVVPQVGSLDPFGDSGEEKKVAQETRKVLGLPQLHVAATTVRVPVRRAHSEAVFVETERPATREELARALESASGVVYHPERIVTPRDVENTDDVHVARLRPEADTLREEGLPTTRFQFWVVGDQLRKGAATNGVQIIELLLQKGMLVPAFSTTDRPSGGPTLEMTRRS
ncbi:MAG: aspartate-semialdehyde dehydrogenase [Candidatus Eremiobacteraeota bacterium]|nr:aspartate-semialdehyde dehydrogenase [Candidatus Eremiobacteraeota bacterium]MBV8355743.1 aspartate-semialdehyde dehydrogenase [Candidatus Eremiobacteraeota bacterium]